MSDGYTFKSSRFDIEPGEDEETNPRRYGRQLATWLKSQFEGLGYNVEEVFGDDWGWCVMCQREPFSLWVGCGNQIDLDTASEAHPASNASDVVRHCFAVAEVSFFKRIFNKPDTTSALAKLDAELNRILASEPSIEFVQGQ
jgi:hypothetical protein